jgi:S-adenosylmethionine-dependent methyltransferase
MPTNHEAFDSHLETWKREESMPWQKVRRRVEYSNLLRHTEGARLRILDAGGGNGIGTVPFAQNRSQVVVADYSEVMVADGRRLVADLGLEKNYSFVLTRLENLPDHIHDQEFDLVICNNVIQYVENVADVLKAILRPLRSQGLISIVSVNRFSIAYHHAFLRGDLRAAKMTIGARETNAIFDSVAHVGSADEMKQLLTDLGCTVESDYGLRCMIDYWGTNETKSEPAMLAQLEELEFALTAEHPYKLLARFYQVVARKD